MYTKRLLRQIVTPSALAYAVLGFFGGLLWLSLTRGIVPALVATSTGRATPAADRPRLGSGHPPGSDRRRAALRRRSRRWYWKAASRPMATGSRRGDLYYLESVSPTRGEDFFKVDARTAEVVEATFRGRMAPAESAVDLSLADAETLPRRFARTHFWGFDQLVLVDRSTRTGETGTIYSFKWSQVARIPVPSCRSRSRSR